MAVSELIVVNHFCSRCGVATFESDNFCRNCGLPADILSGSIIEAELVESSQRLVVAPPRHVAVAPQDGQSLVTEILGNRFYVIAIILCVGPIGLPALWFSHRFSRRSKIVTTIGYFFFTAVLPLAVAWYFLDIAVRPILDALSP